MKGRLAMSLNLRLWAVVLLAVLPIFSMVALDYQAQRRALARDLEGDVLRMFKVAEQQEALALDAVQGALKVMAHANDLQDLDPQACSALARRMLDTLTDYNNLGAALPDGRLFCSGRGVAAAISVRDRAWFAEAQGGAGISRGEYVVGRISGQPSLVFAYPLRGGGRRTARGAVRFDRLSVVQSPARRLRPARGLGRQPDLARWGGPRGFIGGRAGPLPAARASGGAARHLAHP